MSEKESTAASKDNDSPIKDKISEASTTKENVEKASESSATKETTSKASTAKETTDKTSDASTTKDSPKHSDSSPSKATKRPHPVDPAELQDEDSVTMLEVLDDVNELEADAKAVLGGADDKNCTYDMGMLKGDLSSSWLCFHFLDLDRFNKIWPWAKFGCA